MSKKPDAVIFDLNKTLRNKAGKARHHVLKKAEKDAKKEKVIVMTGEPTKDTPEAKHWLDSHGLKGAQLESRPNGDKEHDPQLKEKLFKKDVSRQFKVKKAYDDKKANRDMFKSQGIKAKKP